MAERSEVDLVSMPVADIVDVLGDPVWGSVSALVAVAAILVSVVLYRQAKVRKGLSFELTHASVVSVRDELRGLIEISYQGQVVETVQVISVNFRNSGNSPILREDFDGPLRVVLDDESMVMTVEVENRRPSDLAPDVRGGKGRIEIQPLLLNRGDEFSLTSLVRDHVGPAAVEGRIAGVSKLTDARAGRAARGITWRDAPQLLVAGLALLLVVTGTSSVVAELIDDGNPPARKTHTKYVLKSGESVCGDLRSAGAKRALIQRSDDGTVRSVRTADIELIDADAC